MSKKAFYACFVLAAVAGLAYGILTTGWGKYVSANGTTGVVMYESALSLVKLKVTNTATNNSPGVVYALVNVASNAMAARVAAGTAVRIPANSSYEFDGMGRAAIYSVAFSATNETINVLLQGF